MPNVKIPKAECTQYDLPPMCVVTGGTENIVWKQVKFQYMPPWAFFVGGVILGAIFTKKMTAELPFTEEAYSNYKRAQILVVVAALLPFAVIGGGVGAAVNLTRNEDVRGVMIIASIVVGLAAAIFLAVAFVWKRGPKCVKIDDDFITLTIPSKLTIVAIQERTGVK